MTHTKKITVAPWGTRTLHFHSEWAGRLGGEGNCVTPNATDIYINRGYISGWTLAHEYGHGEQAKKRKWAYLLWIAAKFLKQGYVNSKAEQEAFAFAWANVGSFPEEVRCDCMA